MYKCVRKRREREASFAQLPRYIHMEAQSDEGSLRQRYIEVEMRQLHTSISEATQPQHLCTYIAIHVQNFCMTMNMYGIDPCLAMP